MYFAATHPERVDRLILYTLDPMGDFQPWDDGFKSREHRETFLNDLIADIASGWGTREFARSDPLFGLKTAGPLLVNGPLAVDWYTALMPLSNSPVGAIALHRIYFGTDAQPFPGIGPGADLVAPSRRRSDRAHRCISLHRRCSSPPGARLDRAAGDE